MKNPSKLGIRHLPEERAEDFFASANSLRVSVFCNSSGQAAPDKLRASLHWINVGKFCKELADWLSVQQTDWSTETRIPASRRTPKRSYCETHLVNFLRSDRFLCGCLPPWLMDSLLDSLADLLTVASSNIQLTRWMRRRNILDDFQCVFYLTKLLEMSILDEHLMMDPWKRVRKTTCSRSMINSQVYWSPLIDCRQPYADFFSFVPCCLSPSCLFGGIFLLFFRWNIWISFIFLRAQMTCVNRVPVRPVICFFDWA